MRTNVPQSKVSYACIFASNAARNEASKIAIDQTIGSEPQSLQIPRHPGLDFSRVNVLDLLSTIRNVCGHPSQQRTKYRIRLGQKSSFAFDDLKRGVLVRVALVES